MTRFLITALALGCSAKTTAPEPATADVTAASAAAGEVPAEPEMEDPEEVDEVDEVEVPIDELPEVLVAAVTARFPGATLLEAELEPGPTAQDDLIYEVELVTVEGACYEVEVRSSGEIVEAEPEAECEGRLTPPE